MCGLNGGHPPGAPPCYVLRVFTRVCPPNLTLALQLGTQTLEVRLPFTLLCDPGKVVALAGGAGTFPQQPTDSVLYMPGGSCCA